MGQYPETSLMMRHEQRKYFRFPVEGEAMLFVEQTESSMRCRMLDLGLEGCRLRRAEDFPVKVGMTGEVAFRIAGTLFRFPGTIQWSAKGTLLGLHFSKMSEDRKLELADLLAGMREEMEAREKEAQEKERQAKLAESEAGEAAQANTLHLVSNPVPNPDQAQVPETPAANGEPAAGSTASADPGAPRPAARHKRERREHNRHEIDSHARVHFLSIHARVTGKVIDLSSGGCRIRAQQLIPVGAYRRVEVEFMVDGLPLLLPGVTQSIIDRYTIGIRFVEMTDRKRGQLQMVIDELTERDELSDKNAGAAAQVSVDSPAAAQAS